MSTGRANVMHGPDSMADNQAARFSAFAALRTDRAAAFFVKGCLLQHSLEECLKKTINERLKTTVGNYL